jgi:EAL domain-containing protein (putative c-di-GMP-specific phosphodiesterase class I)
VLRNALALMAGHPGLRIAVNLSGSSLDNPELPTLLHGMLQEQGVEPQRLILEITETATLNLAHAERLLTVIRELGCKLALDDFGVGPVDEALALLQWVTELGVDYAQGYHVGRPQAADAALAAKSG